VGPLLLLLLLTASPQPLLLTASPPPLLALLALASSWVPSQ
jgi:hypothetical protein